MRVVGVERVPRSWIEQLFLDLRVDGEHPADALCNGLLLLVLGGLELLERLRDGTVILFQQLHRVRCGGVGAPATLGACTVAGAAPSGAALAARAGAACAARGAGAGLGFSSCHECAPGCVRR